MKKQAPTKHCPIWLVVDRKNGTIEDVFFRRQDAVECSKCMNDWLEAHVCVVRPAMTADRRKK